MDLKRDDALPPHGSLPPPGRPPAGAGWLERRFRLAEHGTTVRTEMLAGLTTFLTMA